MAERTADHQDGNSAPFQVFRTGAPTVLFPEKYHIFKFVHFQVPNSLNMIVLDQRCKDCDFWIWDEWQSPFWVHEINYIVIFYNGWWWNMWQRMTKTRCSHYSGYRNNDDNIVVRIILSSEEKPGGSSVTTDHFFFFFFLLHILCLVNTILFCSWYQYSMHIEFELPPILKPV